MTIVDHLHEQKVAFTDAIDAAVEVSEQNWQAASDKYFVAIDRLNTLRNSCRALLGQPPQNIQ